MRQPLELLLARLLSQIISMTPLLLSWPCVIGCWFFHSFLLQLSNSLVQTVTCQGDLSQQFVIVSVGILDLCQSVFA